MKSIRSIWLWVFLLGTAFVLVLAVFSITLTKNTTRQADIPSPTSNLTNLPLVIVPPTATPTGTLTLTPVPSATRVPSETSIPVVALRKGPDVILTGDNTRMKVVWQLSSKATATLQWGTDTHYTLGSVNTTEYNSDHQHAYTITGLTPGIKYFYSVVVPTGYSAGTFYTAPPASATSLKFFAFGDTRDGPGTQDQIDGKIVSAYTADPAFQTFILSVGDLVNDGDNETMWTAQLFDQSYKNIRAALANLSFLPVMGNHENSGVLFKKYFPMPYIAGRYWSFDYGPAHVVMLDQFIPYSVGSTQYTWLKNDLAGSSKTWKFIVLHEPGWSAAGGHLNNATVQSAIQPLAEKYGVSIVFGGHTHYYARAVVNGVQHLTVGGGGAPLYQPVPGQPYVVKISQSYSFVEIAIDGNTLTGTTLKSDGSVIETFSITR
ncbi:MAG: metallophosphoesterase family protein [Chloroflexi bacterium]|nr:metallophosphoesterase family protein [Chloroflexota bacterium]